ncbi:MAG: ribosome maturation factor RimP [Actinomycetota bacterium]|nr:ribosome maturation factor RimP [Actinomycetota bacterium]
MAEELNAVLVGLLASRDLELVDVEIAAGTVKVTVDRPGGVDLDSIAGAHRVISGALDELDPFPGRYTLEVSSPGVERRLRTPAHFARAVGEVVSVRTVPGVEPRRARGRLARVDEDGFVLEGDDVPGELKFCFADVERARTVFTWGPGAVSRRSGADPHGAVSPITTTERVTTP